MNRYVTFLSCVLVAGSVFHFMQPPLSGAQRDEMSRISLAEAHKMITQSDAKVQARGLVAILIDRIERSEKGITTADINSVEIDKRCVSILLRLFTDKDDPGHRIFKESGFDVFKGINPASEVTYYFSLWNSYPGARGLLSERIRLLTKNSDESQRTSAAGALVLGILDLAETKNTLDKLSNDSSWNVRAEVAEVVIQLGHKGIFDADQVSGFLEKALFQDKDKRVRGKAAQAMVEGDGNEYCSMLEFRSDLVHSLVTVLNRDDASSDVFLAACGKAALAAKTSDDDAFAIIQSMMRHELVNDDAEIANDSVSLLAYISSKQLSKIADKFSAPSSGYRHKDYLRSLRHCAANQTPDQHAVDCIVVTISFGSKTDAVGTVLGRHNPEVLGQIIRKLSDRTMDTGGSYAFGVLLANIPNNVARKQKEILSKSLQSRNVWVRTGAAIAIISAEIDVARAEKVLHDVVNNAQEKEEIRLMALRALVSKKRLRIVSGGTVKPLIFPTGGFIRLGYCGRTMLCELMNAIASGVDVDDEAARAILSGLKRRDMSTCYRVLKTMLPVAPKLVARLGHNEVKIALKAIRDTVESEEVRKLTIDVEKAVK